MVCPSELVSDGHLSQWDVFRLNLTFLLPEHSALGPSSTVSCCGLEFWEQERFLFSFSPSPSEPSKYSYPCCSCDQYCVLRFPVYCLGSGPLRRRGCPTCLSDLMPPLCRDQPPGSLVVQAHARPPLPGCPFPASAPSHPPESPSAIRSWHWTWPQSGNQFPFFFQATRISSPTQAKVLRTGCIISPHWKPGGMVRAGVPTSSSWLSDPCILAHC